jgi:hypothetical protein
MKNTNINPNLINRISAIDKELIHNFIFVEEKIVHYFFGLFSKLIPAHYECYDKPFGHESPFEIIETKFTLEDIEDINKMIENSILIKEGVNYSIYKKPHVIITILENRYEHQITKITETFEEALTLKEKLCSKYNITFELNN